jgi:hypothetical protein
VRAAATAALGVHTFTAFASGDAWDWLQGARTRARCESLAAYAAVIVARSFTFVVAADGWHN